MFSQTNNVVFHFSKIDNLDLEVLKGHLPVHLQEAHQKRIQEFLAGRYCVFQAANKLNIKLDTLKVNPDKSPKWPKNLKGSISHSKGFVIAALALSTHFISIGIDVEKIITDKKHHVMEKEILTEADKLLVKKNIQLSKSEIYTLIFSAKESLYKLINPLVKKYFGFSEATIIKIDLEAKTFSIKLESQLEFVKDYNGIYEGYFELDKEKVITLLTLA